jgi:hypothetical protein
MTIVALQQSAHQQGNSHVAPAELKSRNFLGGSCYSAAIWSYEYSFSI